MLSKFMRIDIFRRNIRYPFRRAMHEWRLKWHIFIRIDWNGNLLKNHGKRSIFNGIPHQAYPTHLIPFKYINYRQSNPNVYF